MNSLEHISAAKREIAAATTAVEAKNLRDKAEGIRQYAIAAKDEALVRAAVEFKLRAERRLGELLAEMQLSAKRRTNLKRGTARSRGDTTSGLEDAGISRDLSSRAQRIAKVSDAQFEKALKDSPLRPRLRLTPLNGNAARKSAGRGWTVDGAIDRIRILLRRELASAKSAEDRARIGFFLQQRAHFLIPKKDRVNDKGQSADASTLRAS